MQANPTSENWFPKENNNSTLSNFSDYEQEPRKNDFDVFAWNIFKWVLCKKHPLIACMCAMFWNILQHSIIERFSKSVMHLEFKTSTSICKVYLTVTIKGYSNEYTFP